MDDKILKKYIIMSINRSSIKTINILAVLMVSNLIKVSDFKNSVLRFIKLINNNITWFDFISIHCFSF